MNIVNIVKRLASLGHTVVGIELVETAIEEFFAENNIKFNVKTVDDFKVFSVKFIESVDIGWHLLVPPKIFKFTTKRLLPKKLFGHQQNLTIL